MFGGLIDDQISPRVMSSSPPLSAAVEPRIFCFYSVLPRALFFTYRQCGYQTPSSFAMRIARHFKVCEWTSVQYEAVFGPYPRGHRNDSLCC